MDSFDMLYDEWTEARKYSVFCDDGILDSEKWKNSSKIMFLLKETYNHWIEIRDSGAHGPKGGTSPVFWRNMRMWTYIVDEIINGNEPNFNKAKEIKEEPNDSIAYVNIKKLAEKTEHKRQAPSSDDNIFYYASSDKDFLLKQIALISPKIIICSGTFKFCNKIFDKIEPIGERLYKTNEIYLIDFYHLSNRKTYEEGFNKLKSIMEILYKYNNK
jgi:hypothetical protein